MSERTYTQEELQAAVTNALQNAAEKQATHLSAMMADAMDRVRLTERERCANIALGITLIVAPPNVPVREAADSVRRQIATAIRTEDKTS